MNRLMAVFGLCAVVAAADAAVPLKWTVETTATQPAVLEAYQGETLALEAALKSHGKPLEAPAQYSIYWQTNGMGSAYWSTPCAAPEGVTNVMFATWSPAMDVGARVYNCFIGAAGEIYRAAFQLRLRPSPGAFPNTLQPPVQVLDFATVTVANAPWATLSAVSNKADRSDLAALESALADKADASDIPDVPGWAMQPAKPNYTASEVGAASSSEVDEIASAVHVISVHMNAEDARDIVTDYNSATKMPSRRLEYKVPDGPAAGTWRVVWDELTRFNYLLNLLDTNFYDKAQVDAKTDHIPWGVFDSQTGDYSPEKTVQMSSDRVILCAGARYQRVVTTDGPAYWVWTSNEPYEVGGIESNGYFRVSDADGNAAFEVVGGERLTVPATSDGSATFQDSGVTHITIRYPVVAEEHPKLYVCEDLGTHDWKAEDDPGCIANVAWTGSSGDYTGEVWYKVRPAHDQIFVRATYERGVEPYVRFGKAISLTTLKIGGAEYDVGTSVIDGKTVLTLTPRN